MVAQQMTLAALRAAARERSDTEGDPHITDAELTRWINGSVAELYDLLIKNGGENYFTARATITSDGATELYPLPDGTLYGGAPAYYKGTLVEQQYVAALSGWRTVHKMNLADKNRLGRWPAAGEVFRIWYAPRLTELVRDQDIADGVSGWLDYAIVDAARKAVVKQERDPSALMAEKADLKMRIEAMSVNRDQGEPATVLETESDDLFGYGFARTQVGSAKLSPFRYCLVGSSIFFSSSIGAASLL
jgi:hypothetical protein